MDKKIYVSKKNVRKLLDKLNEIYEVFIPVQDKESGIIDFRSMDRLDETSSINFKEKTRNSPKSIVFPSTEKLFSFEYIKDIENPKYPEIRITENLDSGNTANKDKKQKIIFGIKPCDTRGIKSFDLVFKEDNKKDVYYDEKRTNVVLISIGCDQVFPDCFCISVGGNPFNFDNSDIGFVDAGDYLIVLKKNDSEIVKKIIDENKEFFEEKDFKDEESKVVNDMISASIKKLEQSMEKIDENLIEQIIESNFDENILWENISEKCISCAACTYVCPTCLCFDIGDELKNYSGERYRCWDFCTNYYYTLEASGHNPRNEVFQRYRNKINCKFNYFHKRKKVLYCVGCGRCVDICPVGMDIREILKKLLIQAKV